MLDRLGKVFPKPPEPEEDRTDEKEGSHLKHPKRFMLHRKVDHSGVSGTGWVASGVEFSDGTVVVRWYGSDPSTSVWESIRALQAIHGHNGATEIRWLD